MSVLCLELLAGVCKIPPPGTESPSRLLGYCVILAVLSVLGGCFGLGRVIMSAWLSRNCLAAGLRVLSVISSGFLSVPRIPQFLGFSHTLRDVFTLP